MAFDAINTAELKSQTAQPIQAATVDTDWALVNPDRFLAMVYVDPTPSAALDHLTRG